MPDLTPQQKAQLDKNIRSMIAQGADETDVMTYADDFRKKYDIPIVPPVKKKVSPLPFLSKGLQDGWGTGTLNGVTPKSEDANKWIKPIPQTISEGVQKDKKKNDSVIGGVWNTIVGSVARLAGGIVETQNTILDAGNSALAKITGVDKELIEVMGENNPAMLKVPKRKEVVDFIEKARTASSSRENEQARSQFDITNGVQGSDVKALLFQAPSQLLDMLGGAATAGTSFFFQSVNDNAKELEENPNAKKLTDNEKLSYLFIQGTVQAALEKYSIDKILKATGISSKVKQKIANEITDEFVKKGIKATASDIEKAALKKVTSLSSKIKKVGLKTAASSTVEATTEAAQQGISDGIKLLTNKISGNKIFDEEDIAANFFKNIINAGAQGGVFGGVVGGGASTLSSTNKAIRNEIAKAQTPEDIQKIQANIAEQVELGNITEQEANAASITAQQYVEIASTIPEEIDSEKKYAIIGGIEQREQLKKEIEKAQEEIGKLDEVFHEEPKTRIELLQAKLEQTNDYIEGIATGKKTTYKKEGDEYFKTNANGEVLPISKQHYELATAVREEEAIKNKEIKLAEQDDRWKEKIAAAETESEKEDLMKQHGEWLIEQGKTSVPESQTPTQETTPSTGLSRGDVEALKDIEEEFFGKERAKRYKQARRISDSITTPKEDVIVSDRIMREMEESLTEQQRNEFFRRIAESKQRQAPIGNETYVNIGGSDVSFPKLKDWSKSASFDAYREGITEDGERQMTSLAKEGYNIIANIENKSGQSGIGTALVKNALEKTSKGLIMYLPDIADLKMVSIFKKLGAKEVGDFLILENPSSKEPSTEAKIVANEKEVTEVPLQTEAEKPSEAIINKESQPAEEGAIPPTEPPKKPVVGEGGEGDGKKELDKLANNVPDSGEVAKYMSKETIEKYTGETPQNDQTRGVQELQIALEHGEKIIEKAKDIFGSDYVEKTLDYIENSTAGVSNKALMYVSLENALGREKETSRDDGQKYRDLTKQQALVYEQSQKFARENSLALNYQKLRRIAQVGYDMRKVTDNFFSDKEIEGRNEIEKSIEADADAINKEAEKQEVGGMTPEVEKAITEGVAKEVAKIYEALPKDKKSAVDRAIETLESVQKKLRSKTYDAALGVPVAIIDGGIGVIKLALKAGVKIANAVELGIKHIREKYGKKWEKENEFRQDILEAYKEKENKTKPIKDVVKDALIEKGFGREIMVKGEKKNILDWKKLAGAAGTISKIRESVNSVLQEKGLSGLTDAKKGMIKDEFIKEYVDLRASVIEKAQTELAKRNKENVTPEQKSAAKKLAELYTYGLFEKNVEEFELLTHKALGTKVSEQGFKDARDIAHAMETIYANSFKGIRLNDISAKAALEKLEDKLRVLLFREAKKHGNWMYKAASIVRNLAEVGQTMLLNNLKQATENPLSGLQQKVIENLNSLAAGQTTKELSAQNRKLMKDVYKDMVLKGGFGYGKVESQFVNRQHIDDYVNKLSDNEIYHGIMSVVTGKATLNAMDAMYKAGITEKKFTHHLITLLTHETNPSKMSKKDALKFVSESLTGQSFAEAQKTAKQIIERINKDADKELIPTHQEMVDRFANDIVKASLEMGGKITPEQIQAAYGAAYKGAGLGIGHEANNILSAQIKGFSARIEGDINVAIKNKEWNRAAALIIKGVVYRNIINPFVGGGTNWLVIKLEKTGLGLFTGLVYKIGSKQDIDLSSASGLRKLEARLYNQTRWKDNMMRGLVGGAVTWGSYALFLALANTDEYEEWRKKNRWATRYLDIITPEPMLLKMALDEKNPKAVERYIDQSFNRGDAFSAEAKAIKGLGYAAKGEMDKAYGAWGEMIGSKANAPVPWRLFKDGQVLYQGIKGQDPYHGDYKPSSGFANGLLQGGVIEWLGARPKPQVENKFELSEEEKKDPVLKTFIDKGVSFPEYDPSKIQTKEVNGKVTEHLSDYPKETQEKYIKTHKEYYKDELNKLKTGEYEVYKDENGTVHIKGEDTDISNMEYVPFNKLTDDEIKYLEGNLTGRATKRAKADGILQK